MTAQMIPMTEEMARRIIDGMKTQLRIAIDPQPIPCNPYGVFAGHLEWHGAPRKKKIFSVDGAADALARYAKYPVGTKLWVQEPWRRGDGGSLILFADEPWNHGAGWKKPETMDIIDCRIQVEVTAVRAERLHEITPEDADSEGVFCPEWGYAQYGEKAPVFLFPSMWERNNGHGSWDPYLWVWVHEFKVLKVES